MKRRGEEWREDKEWLHRAKQTGDDGKKRSRRIKGGRPRRSVDGWLCPGPRLCDRRLALLSPILPLSVLWALGHALLRSPLLRSSG